MPDAFLNSNLDVTREFAQFCGPSAPPVLVSASVCFVESAARRSWQGKPLREASVFYEPRRHFVFLLPCPTQTGGRLAGNRAACASVSTGFVK